MKRRTYLALGGSIVSGSTVGCLGIGKQSKDTATSTETETETPTETFEPRPRITNAGAVSQWRDIGDLVEYKVNEVPRSESYHLFAVRYEDTVEGQSHKATLQLEIEGPDGSTVGRQQDTIESLTESDGDFVWEQALEFDVRGWPLGEHTGTAIVRNDIRGTTSKAYDFDFDVVEG